MNQVPSPTTADDLAVSGCGSSATTLNEQPATPQPSTTHQPTSRRHHPIPNSTDINNTNHRHQITASSAQQKSKHARRTRLRTLHAPPQPPPRCRNTTPTPPRRHQRRTASTRAAWRSWRTSSSPSCHGHAVDNADAGPGATGLRRWITAHGAGPERSADLRYRAAGTGTWDVLRR